MKVIYEKNCAKKPSNTAKQKGMASIGASAYMSENPKVQIEVIRSKAYENYQLRNQG